METQPDQPKSTLCVMADFGMGPYAWLRGPNKSAPRVGTNVADAVVGFDEEFKISSTLQTDFAGWVTRFEAEYDSSDFDWEVWNEQGIALARRLKEEVGPQYLVEYHYPSEDPRFPNDPPYIAIER